MWTIAGGIILAFVIIVSLPWLLRGAVWLLGIAILIAIVYGLGNFLLNNFTDAMVILLLGLMASASIFLYVKYAQSRDLHLFGRTLVLLSSPAISPRKKAEKEVALKRLAQDVEAHCTAQTSVIKNQAADNLAKQVSKLWRQYREYGDLSHSLKKDAVQFSATDVGCLFSVQISTDFPQSVLPTYLLHDEGERCSTTTMRELAGAIRRVLKRKLLAYERARHRKN